MKDYFIGLNSNRTTAAFAVTDPEYHVLKKNGKSMIGVHTFEEAQTAAERRVSRATRRRNRRKKERILLLQELFAKEISKVDPGFYMRMQESMLYAEDKSVYDKNSMFHDKNYTDIDFHKEFPTIYHLRKALIEWKKPYDIRLVYLGVHHILKHRGHFLFKGSMENVTSFEATYQALEDTVSEYCGIELHCEDPEQLASLLKDKKVKVTAKKKEFLRLIGQENGDKPIKAMASIICGGTGKLADIYMDLSLKNIEKSSINLTTVAYDEIHDELEEILGERCIVLDAIKLMYDWKLLSEVLDGGEYGDSAYLSFAKVKSYEKHKKDLAILKKVIRALLPDEYDNMFNVPEGNNYVTYAGASRLKGKKVPIKRCTKEEFYKSIEKLMKKTEKLPAEQVSEYAEDIAYILIGTDEKTFLPLQLTCENAIIPSQCHEAELKVILRNAEEEYSFLRQKDDSGKTVSEKLLDVFRFRVPYYVGPLNSHSQFSWMVKKKAEKIYPWNINQVVDMEKSANNFIARMTNKCMYLIGEDVLPQNSLLYREFVVYNQMNSLVVKGEKLPLAVRNEIIENVVKKKAETRGRDVIAYLNSLNYNIDETDISGIEKEFTIDLSSYRFFRKIFGDAIDTDKVRDMCENIILWNTVYGEEKQLLKNVIRQHYDKSEITNEQIRKICKKNYKGWSVVSKKLLNGILGENKDTNEKYTVIFAMKVSHDTFRDLLNVQYTFTSEIEKANESFFTDSTAMDYESVVDGLATAPAIKKSIWQTVRVMKELTKSMGYAPKKIFIALNGNNNLPKKYVSRKGKLLMAYKGIKDANRDWSEEIREIPEESFRNDNLYLYYLQKGRCLYSGKEIEMDEINNDKLFNKDHIYPRSKGGESSPELNLVLVKTKLNREKGIEPVSEDIQNKMEEFWTELLKDGLMTQEKYERLTRKTPLSEKELASFISRQMVDTSYSTRLLAGVLKRFFTESQIVYVKSERIKDFRVNVLDAPYVPELNDFTFARSAYLNIVVGNVYNEKFTDNPYEWLKSHKDEPYSLNRMFDYDLKKGNTDVWKTGEDGTIATVRKAWNTKFMLFTTDSFLAKRGRNGGFFNNNIVKKDANASVSIKKGMDVTKYGGYKSLTPSCFALVESDGKYGEKKRSIETIPLIIAVLPNCEEKFIAFCENNLNLRNPKVLLKIKKNALLIIDGYPCNLRGKSSFQLDLQNAVPLTLDNESEKYLGRVTSYLYRNKMRSDKSKLLEIVEKNKLSKKENLALYDLFIEKLTTGIYKKYLTNPCGVLLNGRDMFKKLTIEEQCVTLGEILHTFQCNPSKSNLINIGGKGTSGKLQCNNTIDSHEVSIVYQSITGLYEQKINLNKM